MGRTSAPGCDEPTSYDLKANLDQYQQWQTSLEDTKAIAELLELERDEALLETNQVA
ncbi:MAG: hypothetical protein F6K10_03460 [Moorea sp. SIO2B7]|nr:hypothetical protein [Moorena sp. SIO2B7]